MRGPKKTRTAFVPRVVFSSVCAGVIPACAMVACGGDSTTGQPDAQLLGVAACCFEGGAVAADAFAGDATHDTMFAVADAIVRDSSGDAADAPTDGRTDGDGAG